MVSKNYYELFEKMRSIMIANQDKITNFNQGSMCATIFEAIARVVEGAYIDTRNGYMTNLKSIPYSLFDFEKKAGSYATGSVVFSRTVAIDSVTTISAGTKVSNGSQTFVTTQAATIEKNGLNSNSVAIEAEEIGSEYNVSANTITTIESIVSGDVVLVTNAVKTDGGSNEESDSEMLARFKEYINGLQGNNTYGLKSGVLGINGVRSCQVDEHFPPVNNIFNVTVYVDDGTGNLSDKLKLEIEDTINGTNDKPGLRSAGINVRVLPATQLVVNVSVTCTIYRTEDAKALADIQEAIKEEINTLGIGENVVWTNLILRLRRLSYVTDVSDLLLNGEQENVTVGTGLIARFGAAEITLVSKS